MNPEILETSVLYCGKVFSLIEQQLKLPNGTLTRVETIQHPGATAIVPMIDKSHIILIRQYRYAVRDWIWEIPAGTLSANEDPKDCAHRELTEETAYEAGNLEKIGEILPVPGYSNDLIHVFLATGLRRKYQHLEEDEILDVREVSIDRALEMIKKGEIKDAKTIIGILMTNSIMGEFWRFEPDRKKNKKIRYKG